VAAAGPSAAPPPTAGDTPAGFDEDAAALDDFDGAAEAALLAVGFTPLDPLAAAPAAVGDDDGPEPAAGAADGLAAAPGVSALGAAPASGAGATAGASDGRAFDDASFEGPPEQAAPMRLRTVRTDR
jgi:hypothetical protein